MITIDVISDTVCPWCFVGKRQLEKALEERPQLEVKVTWHPFQLNPDMPDEGKDHRQYYLEKFGSEENVRQLTEHVSKAGEAVGIAFDFRRIPKSPNTLASHRLVLWAASAGVQDEIVERLFSAYFLEGRDIGDHPTLTKIAAEAGMDGELVGELLANGRDVDMVKDEADQMRGMGIGGVPFFIINRKYAISGAQPPAAFIDAFDRVLAEQTSDTELEPIVS